MPERTVVSLTVLVPYVACAAAYLALTALILGQARRSRTGLWLAAAAVATAFWASAGGLAAPPDLAAAFDLLRLLAWYGFCLHLYMEMHRPGTGGAARIFITIGVAGIVCAAAAILLGQADLDGIVSLVSPAILLRLGLGIGQLLVLENLYRDTAPEQRRHVGLACIALGGMAAYDVVLCADAVLVRGFSPALLAGRPVVAVLVTPLLAVAAARNRDWRVDIHVSRTAAFHSATLVVSGVFLLALAAVGELARRFGPALGVGWGSLAEIYLLCAGVLTLAVLLTSGVARSVLRRNLVDHFFTHRYDYRQEWQRCIGVLSAAGPLPQRVIRVLADVVDSPSGLLFLHEPGQPGLAWAGSWNTAPSGPLSAADAASLLAGGAALLTPGQLRFARSAAGAAETDYLDPANLANPADLADLVGGTDLADRTTSRFDPWLAVPLREPDAGNVPSSRAPAAMGCILLAHPRAPFRIDDEVLDLLRILAHEVAIHLAQERAAASLLQTRELHAYGERFAFVAHDIKNVSSQLSLLLANAETHLADPAFQQDMLATVRSSVARIGGLIRRLEPARGPDAANSGLIAPARVDAAAQLAEAAGRARARRRNAAVGGDRSSGRGDGRHGSGRPARGGHPPAGQRRNGGGARGHGARDATGDAGAGRHRHRRRRPRHDARVHPRRAVPAVLHPHRRRQRPRRLPGADAAAGRRRRSDRTEYARARHHDATVACRARAQHPRRPSRRDRRSGDRSGRGVAWPRKLLIVEDDPGLSSQYRWAFPGYDVLLAPDREAALALLARERPPVVIIDLGLPPDPDGVTEGFATLEAGPADWRRRPR